MGDQPKEISNPEDDRVFRYLFLTFFPKVRAMLIRQGAHKETAEEIAQDTMLAVWRKSDQYSSDKGTISAWIYAIARNLHIDRLRKQAVWQRDCQAFETMKQLQNSTTELRSWEQERSEIERALGTLPPEQLQVLQLSFVEGLSQTEIASKLGLPLGTVKSRMRLAFENLRFAGERDA